MKTQGKWYSILKVIPKTACPQFQSGGDMKRTKLGLVGRILVGAGVLFGAVNLANADSYDILCTSEGIPDVFVQAQHKQGAEEPGKSPFGDSQFLENASPAIDFYWQNSDGNLTVDAREPNSTSDFYGRIEGRGLGGSVKANLASAISEPEEKNFLWKNLIIEIYNAADVNDPNNKIGTYDGKDLVNGTVAIPDLYVHDGLSYQIKLKPRNYADLNQKQKVDFVDFDDFAKYWMVGVANAGNVWNNYADINRDGIVDLTDLSYFADEWLWDGN